MLGPFIKPEEFKQCEQQFKDNYGILSEEERNDILSKIKYHKQAKCLDKILDIKDEGDKPVFDKENIILVSDYIGNYVNDYYLDNIINNLTEKIEQAKKYNYGRLWLNDYCKTIFKFIKDNPSEKFVNSLLRKDINLCSTDFFLETLNDADDKESAIEEADYIITNTPEEFWKDVYYHFDSIDKIKLCKKMCQKNKEAERKERADYYSKWCADIILSRIGILQNSYKEKQQNIYDLISKAVDNNASSGLIEQLAKYVQNFDALEPLIDLGTIKDSRNTIKFSSEAVNAIAEALGGYDSVTSDDVQKIKTLVEIIPDITTKQVVDMIKSGTLSDIPDVPEDKSLRVGKYKYCYERITDSNALYKLYPEAKADVLAYLTKMLNHDEKRFTNLVESGYFELCSNEDSPISAWDLFDNAKYNSFFSKNVLNDVKKLYSGEPLVKEFPAGTNLTEIADIVDKGETATVDGKLYVNDDGKMTELKMSKETFEKLFPLVTRFNTKQGDLGDCWLVSSLENLMDLPSGRAKIYQLFEQDGDTITVTVPYYKYELKRNDEDEMYRIPTEVEHYKLSCKLNELIRYNHGKHLKGCLGLQLLENLYTIAKDGGDKKELSHDDVLDLLRNPKKMEILVHGTPYLVVNNIIGCTEPIFNKYLIDYEKFQNNRLEIFNTAKMEDIKNFLSYAANDDKILCYFTCYNTSDDAKRARKINPEYNLFGNHAYSIKGYDKEKGIVYYTNPHEGNSINEMDVYNWVNYIDEIRYTKLDKENA